MDTVVLIRGTNLRLAGLRGPARRSCAEGEGEHDILRRLLELLGHGRARRLGKFAQRLGLVEARKRNGHRKEPAIVPVRAYARFYAGHLFKGRLDRVSV